MKNKKIFGGFAILAIVLLCSFGYNTYIKYNNIPRTAPTPYNQYVDNTYRGLAQTYDSVTLSVSGNGATTSDTFAFTPQQYYTLVYVTTTDTFAALNVFDTLPGNKQNSYRGDILEVQVFNGPSAGKIKFIGGNWAINSGLVEGGELIGTVSKRSNIIFRFDGVYWCEISRSSTLTN